jgi:hypothetical protein
MLLTTIRHQCYRFKGFVYAPARFARPSLDAQPLRRPEKSRRDSRGISERSLYRKLQGES